MLPQPTRPLFASALRHAGAVALTTTLVAVPLTLALPAQAGPAHAALTSDETDWLHVEGNQIVDENGKSVWMTGVNWFGFNASERVFHGLWSGNITSITKSMADRGINLVRVPISSELLLEWRNGETIMPNVNTYANPELAGLNNLEIFDYWLDLCEQNGLKVVLDAHSAEADNSGHVYPMWYKDAITTEDVYLGWEWFADRYKNNDTVIGADLENEPHGTQGATERAKWDDSTDIDNFKYFAETAASRILAKNPNLLILVEGIEIYPKEGVEWTSTGLTDYYTNWWGGNLRGVAEHPIDLGEHQDQLVYSPHDYGPLVYQQPWFEGTDWDRESLERDVWDPNWLYIHKQDIAPLLIGEWGGFLDDGPNEKWMVALRDLIAENRLHHTFWVLNPNSGDTGGLLTNDWATWDEEKYDILEPALWSQDGSFVSLDHEVPLGGAGSTTGISLSEAVGGTVTEPTDPPTEPSTDTVAPSTPTALAAGTTTTSTVPLTWTASTDAVGVTGYDVYQGSVKVASSTTPKYTVTGLAPATEYTFSVRAKDAAGNVSAASTSVTATTAAATTPAGTCTVAYSANSWVDGFTGTLKVTNTGTAALSAWTLGFTFADGQKVTNGWSGIYSQTGADVTVANQSWNGTLQAGATIEIGFNGSHTGTNTVPSQFTLNGAVCSTS
ncbi:cellulase family glycosylhydrolase [Sanguibacter antarcticus]|uniref:cellulase n=1 Tax=Sanguibacter antarcticus TaxID=372484 RepID=A0A2A9E6J3_9MICO|nr:cellulase family glycosylhydrolase [Sanguibacter antarcticus]PFG33829.1 aryl-phospho-beta-D-glucosidase BglC (GH1 family) [Sanguibacter antarcticus]